MNCQQTQKLLDALVDGELFGEQQHEVAQHLSGCPACAKERDERERQAKFLRDCFRGRAARSGDVHQRVVESLRKDLLSTGREGGVESRPAFFAMPAGPLAISVAAGALLLLLASAAAYFYGMFDASRNLAGKSTSSSTFAVLNLAAGLVECRRNSASDWVQCRRSEDILVMQQVRAKELPCELLQQDGSLIRLDQSTLVNLLSSKQLSMEAGRVWVFSAGAVPITISTGDLKILVHRGHCHIVCNPKGEVTVDAMGAVVRIERGEESWIVQPGMSARIAGQSISIRRLNLENLILVTRWIHELLLLKDEFDPEWCSRTQSICASLGHSKLGLYEMELKRLGNRVVVPMLAFLQSDIPQHRDKRQRRKATEILTELASIEDVPKLIVLLDDEDPWISQQVEDALWRITGRPKGERVDLDAKNAVSSSADWQDWIRARPQLFSGNSSTGDSKVER